MIKELISPLVRKEYRAHIDNDLTVRGVPSGKFRVYVDRFNVMTRKWGKSYFESVFFEKDDAEEVIRNYNDMFDKLSMLDVTNLTEVSDYIFEQACEQVENPEEFEYIPLDIVSEEGQ